MNVVLANLSEHSKVLFASDVTGNLTEPLVSATGPKANDDGIIEVGSGGAEGPAGAIFMFYGDSTQTDIVANIYRMEHILPKASTTGLWIPRLACILTAISCNSSNQPGIAGSPVGASRYFAYTMTAGSAGTSGVDWAVTNGTAGQVASVLVTSQGARFLKVAMGKGSASNVNCVGKRA